MKSAAPRKHCQRCEDAGCDPVDERCIYCRESLKNRHEHDHFPIPKRHGGKDVFPVCLSCHDAKDRVAFKDWDIAEAWKACDESPTEVRIFAARLFALYFDIKGKAA